MARERKRRKKRRKSVFWATSVRFCPSSQLGKLIDSRHKGRHKGPESFEILSVSGKGGIRGRNPLRFCLCQGYYCASYLKWRVPCHVLWFNRILCTMIRKGSTYVRRRCDCVASTVVAGQQSGARERWTAGKGSKRRRVRDGIQLAELRLLKKKKRGKHNSNHQNNVKEMLGLYEASYFAMEGEEELYEIGNYHCKKSEKSINIRTLSASCTFNLDRSLLSLQLVEEIDNALKLPLQWIMQRLQARWFIDAYGRQKKANPILLELTKLDFNMVQSNYKLQLQEMSRLWRNSDLICDGLNFLTDRLICVITLFNTMNDIAFSFSLEKGVGYSSILETSAYLVEARWYQNGYTPTLDECLENA
ncbi:hypothetical protein IEQ34_021668 [Dendrobium chrysotoxum]|uniref:Uncharacterized protein n=1 Tax=Dendrobium chrysotoxum TaxID=161865 RepID=A0AAV7G3L2_DENCH|nr:hypothetical protein IEQ34_021668 [Dendrobium chrysotoxum]